jgi:biopolymer transport protein ExbD
MILPSDPTPPSAFGLPPLDSSDSAFGLRPSAFRRKRPRPHKRDITMNLVAMLDMAFQLLIFFVLTANFAEAEGVLTANLPAPGEAAQAAAAPTPTVPVTLIKIGTTGTATVIAIELEGSSDQTQVADFPALTRALEERIHGGLLRPEAPVAIVPQDDVPWQDVVNAFNATVSAHLENVAFGSEKTE